MDRRWTHTAPLVQQQVYSGWNIAIVLLHHHLQRRLPFSKMALQIHTELSWITYSSIRLMGETLCRQPVKKQSLSFLLPPTSVLSRFHTTKSSGTLRMPPLFLLPVRAVLPQFLARMPSMVHTTSVHLCHQVPIPTP